MMSNITNHSVELVISPDIRLVGMTAEYIGAMCTRVLGASCEVLASRVIVAAHELLENSVRYSALGPEREGRIRVTFEQSGRTIRVVLETQNRANATRRLQVLGLIAEIQASKGSRRDYYQKLLRQMARRRDGSGLGLGRVFAEAEMDLSCEIRGETVHLRASTIVSAPLPIENNRESHLPS